VIDSAAMAIPLEIPNQYGDVAECMQAARANLERVRKLLTPPSAEAVDAAAAILREVEVQLGCVSALWKSEHSRRDPKLKPVLEEIRKDVAVLAEFFSQTERLFDGWIRAIQTKRGGYDKQGHAAALILVNQVNVEG
jgi:hypothetical protein